MKDDLIDNRKFYDISTKELFMKANKNGLKNQGRWWLAISTKLFLECVTESEKWSYQKYKREN